MSASKTSERRHCNTGEISVMNRDAGGGGLTYCLTSTTLCSSFPRHRKNVQTRPEIAEHRRFSSIKGIRE